MMTRRVGYTRFTFALLCLVSMPLCADSFFDQFIDPKDGKFDASKWLLDNKGFLPAPIIITEPALGPGLGVAAIFFHGKEEEYERIEEKLAKGEELMPPSLSVGFGAATENGTWLAGGAHRGIWKDDNVRYLGALARASINLTFYGLGDELLDENSGLDFNGDGIYFLQEALFRVKDSNFFLGLHFDYTNLNISFDDPPLTPPVPESDLDDTTIAGLGLLAMYDSRDNTFTPNRGIFAEVEATHNEGSSIGDFSFQKYNAKGLFYWTLDPKLVLGWRLDGRFARGDPPFYTLPYIDLRGIPIFRYQGDNVLVTEVEARWQLDFRWSLVGFTGVGKAESKFNEIFNTSADLRHTIGGGVRYLMARRLGMYSGFDIARGPEDTAFYLQFGGAWH